MTTATDNLTPERIAELITEAREIARAEPEHEWDRRAIDWPLTSESVVVEVGGYKGRWAYQIAERYNPQLYVFEPQPWAYEVCKGVLEGCNAQVFNYALGTHNSEHPMGKWGTDGCSFFWKNDTEFNGDQYGEIRDAVPTLNDIGHIDLMLMNIEGYEYTLLPYILDACTQLPDRLIVQFHTYFDPRQLRLKAIRQQMRKWYSVAWDYGPTLIAWQRKEVAYAHA